MSPAKRRGVVVGVDLKMTGVKSLGVLGSNHSHYKDLVWQMNRDDGSESPYFTSVCGEHKEVCLYVCDFTPVSDLDKAATEQAASDDGYTINQRHAVKTFTTMLERAKRYRENGERNGFDPEAGICDNIGDCRPSGAGYDEMYRVKDNIIRVVPSYSGNYHYPVKHPNPRPNRDIADEAENAWDNNNNKWAGEYGAMRVIQLEELIEHVKTKWNENLVTVLTPAQQRGIIIHETVCQHINNGTLWVMQRDDESSNPYFIPFGNTGTDGRTDLRLKDLNVLSSIDGKKRSVRGFLANAKRIVARRERLEREMSKIQNQLTELKGALAMNDYQLAQQHSVKRIDK